MSTRPPACVGPITVLCVDDSPEIVRMLLTLIGRETDMIAVGGVHDPVEFIGAAKSLKPCVAVVDLTMPGHVTPIEAIRRVSEEVPETRVIAYSGYDDHDTQRMVMEAGAWGFVSKHADFRTLMDAVRKVAAGEIAV